MHILDLTTIYPNVAVDFEGRSVRSLNQALRVLGARVTVLVMKPRMPLWAARRIPAYRHLAVPDHIEQDNGMQVIFNRYPHLPKLPDRIRFSANINSMTGHALRLSRRHHLRPDIVHAQGITAGLAAGLVAERLKVPFAVTLRDDLSHLHAPTIKLDHLHYRRMFTRAAAFFAIGPKQMADAPTFIPEANISRLRLAPNGVQLGEIQQITDSFPPKHDDFAGRIVSVSNLYRWKGIHENLYAMAGLVRQGLTDWTYTIVGAGPYREDLEALAGLLGIAKQVFFMGRVSHREALRHIYDADIFCLPSWQEAFGNVFAEAALCQTPAIGCLKNGPELLIDNGRTGFLVPPRDVDALTDALARLLSDPEKAQQMGRQAPAHISTFTWDRTARQYFNIYTDLLKRVDA